MYACGHSNEKDLAQGCPVYAKTEARQAEGAFLTAEKAQDGQGGEDVGAARSGGYSCDSHVEDNDQQQVEHHIDAAGKEQDVERALGVAFASEHGLAEGEDHEEGNAKEIDSQEEGGLVEDGGRRAHEAQQTGSKDLAEPQQQDTGKDREHHRRAYRVANTMAVVASDEVGDDGIGTNGDTHKKVDEEIDKKGIGAHGSQRLTGGKAAHHGHVDGDEELLHDAACRKGKRKTQNLAQQRALGHIHCISFCHSCQFWYKGTKKLLNVLRFAAFFLL